MLEGDRYGALRLLRGAKNRFGSTEETGVLEMTGEGLRDVPDPARAFLGAGGARVAGRRRRGHAGGHPADPGGGAGARGVRGHRHAAAGARGRDRRPAGAAGGRARLGGAAWTSRSQRLYVSLVGGATVSEPALDLPVALALASTSRDVGRRAGHRGLRRGVAAGRAATGAGPRATPAGGGPAGVPRRPSCRRGEDGERLRPASPALRDAAPDRRGGRRCARHWTRSIGSGPVPSG